MGRKSLSGGVRTQGRDRIEFTFFYKGQRYRPTLKRAPTEANLRRARLQLEDIKRRIDAGTFNFTEEFPEYKFKSELEDVKTQTAAKKTCGEVFDDFLAHCEMRVAMSDMAFSTLDSYRQILESVWRPARASGDGPPLGDEPFEEVRYSRLARIATAHTAKKKTYNNIVSALRCAFDYGFKDHPEKHNPASELETLRITKKDRPPIDPFTIQEGELIIAASHAEFGAAHGNYEEFRFFTGLRPSEQIALTIHDCDLAKGKIAVNKAVVRGREKDRTKTGEDRTIALCGRALDVLRRQLELREDLARRRRIDHDLVFFQEDGSPILNLSYPYDRWRYVLESRRVRYRDAYNARHSYISWRLMASDNILLVAKEDGHSVQTMLDTYAAWTEGATAADVELIKRARERSPEPVYPPSSHDGVKRHQEPLESPEFAGYLPVERQWGRLSWRKYKAHQTDSAQKKWRSGRDSNPRPPA
jgi:integrase